MAASISIEEDRGTYFGSPHPHNGYYAGEPPPQTAPPSATPARTAGPGTSTTHWAAGGSPHGTNNQGELQAVLELLRATAGLDEELLVIHCDSST